MLRRVTSLLVILTVILNMSFCFGADTSPKPMISSDELIVGEPTTDILYANKSVFVNVNISVKSKVNLTDHPIKVTLSKIEDKLPYAEDLGKDLNVPIIKLSSSAMLKEYPEAIDLVYMGSSTETDQANSLEKETDIINKYFKTVDKINSLSAEITSANKKYKLDLLKETDIAKLNKEMQEIYKKWTDNKQTLTETKKSFSQIQAAYLKLFEVEVYTDQIGKPSYLKELGKLDIGYYKLRFVDEKGVFIKEMSFEVVNEEDTLKTVTPAINVNDSNGN